VCKREAKTLRNHGYYMRDVALVAARTKARQTALRVAHPQEVKQRGAAQSRRFRALHPDLIHEINTKYYATHRNEIIAQIYRYRSTHCDQIRIIEDRHTAKRRALGFIPLNIYFFGCEGHHIDKERVIFIPAELHKSVRHNIWTGKNMDKINELAYEWLAKECNA